MRKQEKRGGLMDNVLCLACGGKSVRSYSWRSLYRKQNQGYLCQSCQSKLEKLEGPCCRKCARMLKDVPATFVEADLCYDCVRWEKRGAALAQNHSLYVYNDYLKELLALFKYRGDYAIVKIFAEEIRAILLRLSADYIVPIPLSEERLYERRFNQSEAIISEAGFVPSSLLTRTHSEKQSKKSRHHRMNRATVFQMDRNFSVQNKKIVLVDDIYTTGSTLQQAAEVLRKEGAKHIQSVTVAR